MLELWDAVERVKVPTLLVKGAQSSSVSSMAIDEWKRRQPQVEVVVVEGAGHSVQSDKPVRLAHLLSDFLEANRRSADAIR